MNFLYAPFFLRRRARRSASNTPSGTQRFLKAGILLLALSALGGMTSCVGVNADIVFNADNSGTITLTYRISRLLDSLGKLEGTDDYPPVPVGKPDIERSVARLPGLTLLSYASQEDEKDRIITVKLRFASVEDLVAFMGSRNAVYSREGGAQKITFTFNGEAGNNNSGLESLIAETCTGYLITVSMTFPSSGSLRVFDNLGQPSGSGDSSGKKTAFAFPLEAVLFSENGLNAEFTW